jgi:ribosomal protein L11 methyltransferase
VLLPLVSRLVRGRAARGLRGTQALRKVADDAIHSVPDEGLHDRKVIDGPRQYVEMADMRRTHQITRYQQPQRVDGRRMQLLRPPPCVVEIGVLPEQPEPRPIASRANHRQCFGLEAGDDRRVECLMATERADEKRRQQEPVPTRRFYLDIQARGSADQSEDLWQAEHRLAGKLSTEPAASIQRFDLSERMVAHRAATVGGPCQVLIVQNYELLITGQLYIEFDHIRPELECPHKGRAGVLGGSARSAPVGNPQPWRRHGVAIRNATDRVKSAPFLSGALSVQGALRCVYTLCHTGGVALTWIEVTINVPQRYGDAVGSFLLDCGTPGLQCADDGETAQLTAYFSTQPPVDALQRLCVDLGCTTDGPGGLEINTREVIDEDWAHNWKRHSQPQLVGDRLYVSPSWAAPAPVGRIPIIIDPGMAFGTGQHASTRGCLLQIERAIVEHRITRALDVGTGSGILAIALAKLGVQDIWAVDTDPTARAVATANAAANGVAMQVHVLSDVAEIAGSFDLVVANLYADLLEALAPRLAERLRADGTLIVSGLLPIDEVRVRAAYERLRFAVGERHVEEPWVTLRLRRRAQS